MFSLVWRSSEDAYGKSTMKVVFPRSAALLGGAIYLHMIATAICGEISPTKESPAEVASFAIVTEGAHSDRTPQTKHTVIDSNILTGN